MAMGKGDDSQLDIDILISVDNKISTYSAPRIVQAINYVTHDGIVNHNKSIVDYMKNGFQDTKKNTFEEEEEKVKKLAKKYISQCDGLVIPGNSFNINPYFYSDNKEDYKKIDLSDPNNRRNIMEIELVKEAMAAGIPILGICGGHQIINVALGGKINFVRHEKEKPAHQKNKNINDDEIDYLMDTQLYTIIKTANNDKNETPSSIIHEEHSDHDQTIVKEVLPKELQVSGEDNIYMIKSVEMKGHHPFTIGVQFHPEHNFDPGTDHVGQDQHIALFREFIDVSKAVRQTKTHKSVMVGELEMNVNLPAKKINTLMELDHLDEINIVELAAAIKSVASLQYVIGLKYSQADGVKVLPITEEQIIKICQASGVIKTNSDLVKTIRCLPEDIRYNIASILSENIADFDDLSNTIKAIPLKDRYDFALLFKDKIKTSNGLEKVLELLPEEKIIDYVKQLRIFQEDENHHTLFKAAKDQDIKVVKAFLNAGGYVNNNNETNEKSPLHVAANQDWEVLNILIMNGADINIKNNTGNTIIHQTIMEKNDVLIDKLLNMNPDFNAKNSEGNTYIHLAIQNDDENLLNKLIDKGADLDIANNEGNTPLHLAILNKNAILIQILLEKNINVNLPNIDGNTPLHLAVINKDVELIQALLKNGANVNAINIDGYTPLHLAILNKDIISIKQMLASENIDITKQNSNTSCIHLAALSGDIEIFKLIFKLDTNAIYKLNADGHSVFHTAAQNGSHDILKFLIANHPHHDINDVAQKNKQTCLHLAAINGHTNIVNLLLKTPDININQVDENGNTALHLASAQNDNRMSVIKPLLDAGADAFIKNNEQKIPLDLTIHSQILQKLYESHLYHAVSNNNSDMLRSELQRANKLILFKMCLQSKYENGNNLLHIAAKNGYVDICSQLIKAGVKQDLKNSNNETAMQIASNDEIRNLLSSPKLTSLIPKPVYSAVKPVNTASNPVYLFAKQQNFPGKPANSTVGLFKPSPYKPSAYKPLTTPTQDDQTKKDSAFSVNTNKK